MATVAAAPSSVADRPAAVRARPDLTFVRRRRADGADWIVKNPLSLDYYRLLEEEHFLLQQLDGRRSLEEIRRAFEVRFAPQTIDHTELRRYIAVLHRDGLVVSAAAGQANVLHERGAQRAKQARRERTGSLLSLRFRGFDPDRLLDALYPYVRAAFAPWCVALCFALMAAAGLTVVAHWDQFVTALPSFHEFFAPSNAFWIAATLGIVKVLHEFGHGFSCKHFGGRCHELGFMLLCFTPTLYCNVTDSWLLPSRRQRAIIGAAGIYVELVLASLAVFVWRFSEPGLVHSLALNVIFVCSVSTLLVNLNPLMRYDGYYILSDVLDITNLGGKASAAWRALLGRVCLGLKSDEDDSLAPRRQHSALAVYAVLAVLYRWFVFFGILWFLNKCFEPYRLDFIGHLLGATAVAGVVMAPVRGLQRFFAVPGRIHLVNKTRLTYTCAAAAALVVAALWLPLPHRVYAPLETAPRDAQSVFVEVSGVLEEVLVKPGDRVEVGQPLARLANVDVKIEVDRLLGQRDETRVLLASLKKERFTDPLADAGIALAEQSLAAYERLLEKRQGDLDRLILRARAAGVVLPPPEVAREPADDGRLPSWHGTPLEPKNLGCTLPQGALFCRIGDPLRMEAMLVVDQGDVEFVALDQEVDIRLDELPGRIWQASIREMSKADLKIAPRALSNKSGGEVATRTDESGQERLRSAAYQVRVLPLDDPDGLLRIALRGEAKIHVGSQTAAQKLARAFSRTFHFDW